jgi:hypothetical protein
VAQIKNLPTENSNEVVAAPIQTSLHAIWTSGTNLQIIAKSNVINANETTRSKMCAVAASIGRKPPTISETAVKTALMISETSNKKPTLNTMA